jgi:hypothetical protein
MKTRVEKRLVELRYRTKDVDKDKSVEVGNSFANERRQSQKSHGSIPESDK